MDEILQGKYKWQIKQKLAEGDAGEVYLVVRKDSLLGGQNEAILKRPRQNPAHAMRQAPQIKLESDLLTALQGANINGYESQFSIKTTELLDRGVLVSTHYEKFFIVMEKAEGVSLEKIQKVAQSGIRQKELVGLSKADQLLARRIAMTKRIPDFILLASIYGCFLLLDYAHTCIYHFNGKEKRGIVWNDPKPNHVFWSCENKSVTIIDWGNGDFLEQDGITSDRENSAPQDNIHFLKEFGKFVADLSPRLFSELSWNLSPNNETIEADIRVLKDSLQRALGIRVSQIREIQRREKTILQSNQGLFNFNEILGLQEKIIEYGVLPDYKNAEILYFTLISHFVKTQKFSECEHLLDKIRNQPLEQTDRWALIEKILKYRKLGNQKELAWSKALVSVCEENWLDVLWNLANKTDADIFSNIARDVRKFQFGIEKNTNFPFDALVDIRNKVPKDSKKYKEIAYILENWKEIPGKNATGIYINYENEVKHLREIGISEEDINILENAIRQSQIHLQIFSAEWEKANFDAVQLMLRRLFTLDPDHSRLLWTSERVVEAKDWLDEFLKLGSPDDYPKKDGFKNKIHAFFKSGLSSEPNLKLKRLYSTGKHLQSVFGNVPWLDKRVVAIELYLDGVSKEFKLYQLLKNDLQLWEEFKPLVGPDFLEKVEKKEKDKLRQQFKEKLERLYKSLRIWHPAGFMDMLTDPAFAPWALSYKKLLHAMEESIKGNYLDLTQINFPDEDNLFHDAVYSIGVVKEWENKLINNGIEDAGRYLKLNSSSGWENIKEALKRQEEIDNYRMFFSLIDNKKWKQASTWLSEQGDTINYQDIKEILNFLIDQFDNFEQNNSDFQQRAFAELSSRSAALAGRLRGKIQMQNNKNYLLLAREWNTIPALLDSIHKSAASLSKENPSFWGFTKNGIKQAFSYLAQLSMIEELTTGRTRKSSFWRSTTEQIIDKNKAPEQVSLDNSHPLYKWLMDYYASRQERERFWGLVRNFVVVLTILGVMLFGVSMGGMVLSAIAHWPTPSHFNESKPVEVKSEEILPETETNNRPPPHLFLQ